MAAGSLALALLTGACSDAGGNDGTGDRSAGSTTTSSSAPTGSGCDLGVTGDLGAVTPVVDTPSDLVLTSFDGTLLRIHWFPVSGDAPAPTVLMGPGWSLAGDTSPTGAALFGALSIGDLNRAGYNVLTWDPRGFGQSAGTVTVNAPDFEGRDVRVLLDWVSEQPVAQLDDEGDPRVGMIGASYGAGIQLTTAGLDCRVDALVPNMAWHSLETSLYRGETVKAGWAGVLANIGGSGNLDPHIASAYQHALDPGTITDDEIEWFRGRGPADLVEQVRAPTLILQGTVDTLFTLDEGITNLGILTGNGVPVAMAWYCGGHGVCLTEEPHLDWVAQRTEAWLARWLKDDTSVDTGPAVEIVDQHGRRYTADAYPAAGTAAGTAGALVGTGAGGSLALAETPRGPLEVPGPQVLTMIVSEITPTPATVAVETTVTATEDALVVGAPVVEVTYSGTTPDGTRPTRIFAQLVDPSTGTVVGNQVTPIPVTLDGAEHTAEVPLETIAHLVTPGAPLTLQLIATTPAYSTPRLGGSVDISSVRVELPVPDGFTAE